MMTNSHILKWGIVGRSVAIALLILALMAQSLSPVFAGTATYLTGLEQDSKLSPVTTTPQQYADSPQMLFRSRIQVGTTHQWHRLEELDINILEQGSDWAHVLVDFDQLETLARLRFDPQAIDDLSTLVSAHSQTRAWLETSLQPLFAQARAVQQEIHARGAETAEAVDIQPLRSAMRALTSEQLAGIESLPSLDDDGDGLTNTEEAWWCTDPLNPDSDGDGVSDGNEVAALKEWMANQRPGPPAGGKPFGGWPPETTSAGYPGRTFFCQDDDRDSVPDMAERWMLGLNMNRESTSRDKFDDGQKLFGYTNCPGGNCNYGSLPRSLDGGFVGPDMPGWVESPGTHPLVAAYPVVEIDVVESSLRVETVTTVTTDHTISQGSQVSYATTQTDGTSTSVENTVTWDEWQEIAESLQEQTGGPTALAQIGSRRPSGIFACGDEECISYYRAMALADEYCRADTGNSVGLDVGKLGGSLGSQQQISNKLLDSKCEGAMKVARTISDRFAAEHPEESAQLINNFAVDNKVYNTIDNNVDVRVDPQIDVNNQVVVNNHFDTDSIVRGLDGVALAYRETGELIGDGLFKISSGLGEVTASLDDISQGIGDMSGHLGDIAAILASPVRTTSTINGSSHGGAQATSHSTVEEHSITNSESFSNQEAWGTATAVNSSHAAELWFSYQVRNSGTDMAREIKHLAFNIYIGRDPNPACSYFVGSTACGVPVDTTLFTNLMPGEERPPITSFRIPLTLEQMKAIDLGGPVRIVVIDYSYGEDELFYEHIRGSGVLLAIEDGDDDGDNTVDRYPLPTWGDETLLDAMARYFPHVTDANGNLVAIWTPEYRADTPSWCREPQRVGQTLWCQHALTVADWWDVYMSETAGEDQGYQNAPATPGSVAFFRFDKDSDWDGYNDRAEIRLGTDPNDPLDYPKPELIGGTTNFRTGNEMLTTLSLLNTGLSDAFAVEAIMLSPDATTTVITNTVGGSARVRGQSQVVVGSRINLQSPLPDPWRQPSHARPAVAGYFAGVQPVTYTFTVQCALPGGCQVGQDNWSLLWSDTASNSGGLAMGNGYNSPLFLDVGSLGVKLSLYTGTAQDGESFTVTARPPWSAFRYRINSEPYTPPVVLVSYNDPTGNQRFMIPPTAADLGDPYADLLPFQGQMLTDPGIEIVTTTAITLGLNTTNLVVTNPSTDTTFDNAHLYVEFIDPDGKVVLQAPYTVTIPPGPTVVPVQWSTADFSPAFASDRSYFIMAFLTDQQNTIVDKVAQPFTAFYSDSPMKISVPQGSADLGSFPHPESYGASITLSGASHMTGAVQQSATYSLRGNAGQPTTGSNMASNGYRLSTGFWAAVQPQMQGGTLAIRTPSLVNDALERFPTHCFSMANTGRHPLKLRAVPADSSMVVTLPPSATLQSGEQTQVCVRLGTDGLGIGSFDKVLTVYTSDPTNPVVSLHLTGEIVPSGDVVFTYGYRDDARPLNRIARVNSTRMAGNVVSFRHGVSGDTAGLHPLLLLAGDGTTELGRGEALGGASLRRIPGDAGATELTLPDATATRRDYVVQYGHQVDLPVGGGQQTIHVSVPNQNYDAVSLNILVHNPASSTMALSLDVGNDGSVDWSFNGTVSGGKVVAQGLATAVNAYRAGHSGAEVVVPMRLSGNTQGTYFLASLVGAASTDLDVSPVGFSASNTAPMETEIIQLCSTVANYGEGVVDAAVVDYIVAHPHPEVDANILIDYAVLSGLTADGGQQSSCVDWDTTGFTGEVTLYAVADFADQLTESDETNNVASITIPVLSRPDLKVATIEPNNTEPVTGEAVSVAVVLMNDGQTNAGDSVLALYEGDPANDGMLIGEQTFSVPASGEITTTFMWTPVKPGAHRLFTIVDRDNAVNEYDEGNNRTWQDIYVGFAGPLLLDSGGPNDPPYTETLGYGVVDEGQPDIIEICGTGSAPEDTLRRDNDGRVVYRFDHLLPGHFYHLNVTLRQCDNIPRQESVLVDDILIAGPVDLDDTQARFLSLLLDPALYANRTISVTIEAEGGDGALVGEVNLYDVDYRYADAGGGRDPQYPGSQGFGWLEGVSSTTWGTLPYQSARINPAGSQLRYRFDGLQPGKRYAVNLTFFQSSGAGRLQRVEIDGQPTGLEVNTGDYTVHREQVFVPASAYADDGSIVVGVVRIDGGTTGAMVNEISLEELTVRSPDIALAPTGVTASQAQGVLGSQPLSIDNIGTANLGWAVGEAASDCASPSDVAWLGVSPTSGTTAAGSSTALAVSLDARSLSPATYTARLCISSNDPDEPVVSVPVELTVTPATNVPRLAIPSNVPGNPFQTVTMPVQFTHNGTNIAVLTFSVDYDQTCLQFDPTDADEDGVPDAVTFSVTNAFQGSVSFDPDDTDGELDFFIRDTFPPLSALPDGAPATVQFRVICQSPPGNPILARVGFATDPSASFGSTTGGSVPGVTSDGSVAVQSVASGDCNADTRVDAGDISAVVLEIFDGDGNNPANAPGGSFAGSSVGCNANQDAWIDAGDISCTVLTIFNGPGACGGMLSLEALGASGRPPALSLLEAKVDGERMTVPIVFTPGDHQISSLAFAIDYDPAVAGIDPTDADGNGIPDAVVLSLPSEFAVGVIVNQQTGRLQIMIADVAAPLAALPEQMIAQVTWQVKNGESASAGISLSIAIPASFGNTSGQSVSTSNFVKRE